MTQNTMPIITRGTTPTVILRIKSELSLYDLKTFYVTFKQGKNEITKTQDDKSVEVFDDSMEVTLTQGETLFFNAYPIDVQLRGMTTTGKAIATKIRSIQVGKILLNGEIK